MIKYNLSQLKKKLLFRKDNEIYFYYNINIDGTVYKTHIRFWRLDTIPELKDKYPKETYVLLIERGDARYALELGNLNIDERHEFHTIEEIIEYLDKKGYLKREDWIIEEKKQNEK